MVYDHHHSPHCPGSAMWHQRSYYYYRVTSSQVPLWSCLDQQPREGKGEREGRVHTICSCPLPSPPLPLWTPWRIWSSWRRGGALHLHTTSTPVGSMLFTCRWSGLEVGWIKGIPLLPWSTVSPPLAPAHLLPCGGASVVWCCHHFEEWQLFSEPVVVLRGHLVINLCSSCSVITWNRKINFARTWALMHCDRPAFVFVCVCVCVCLPATCTLIHAINVA